MQKTLLYRISQLAGILLGARVFVTLLHTFALYTSTFFLFNTEESLSAFIFDFKVHAIIFCSVLSLLAGGIINQFYDREKDLIIKPFRSRLQSFTRQKYFLYAYLAISALSLLIAALVSFRVFIFYLAYQSFLWFYSHKLSRIAGINNLIFVALTLYPFAGMLVYYGAFSLHIFLMGAFIFLFLLFIDILKDTLTKNADKVFGYSTIPNTFGSITAFRILIIVATLIIITITALVYRYQLSTVLQWYYLLSIIPVIGVLIFLRFRVKNSKFISLNIMRFWILLGIFCMLIDGISG